MTYLEKIGKEIGFKPGDVLTVEQMTQLLSKKLDVDKLFQVSSVVGHFTPVATAALNGIARSVEAAGKVDEAAIDALKQSIVELGRFHNDSDVHIRRMAVEHIIKISDKISAIQTQSGERTEKAIPIMVAIFLGVLGLGRLALGGRSA